MSDAYLVGQDVALGPQHDVVLSARRPRAWRSSYENSRKTEEVKLRLSPADALALRIAAKASALSVSAYVARLFAVRENPHEPIHIRDPLADASSVAAALCQIPNELRRLRGDLLRLGGLVKSLFIRTESMQLTKDHADPCSNVLSALTSSAQFALPVVARVEDELASVRIQLEQVILGIMRDP